jgi:hypothetical protein
MTDQKPLFFQPAPGVGFSAERREDGGMNLIFEEINRHTLGYWHRFAEDHLMGSDRLVRNLYDLRKVEHLSEDAIKVAIQLNSDPSTRNIRLAVVVSNEEVQAAVQKIRDLSAGGGSHMAIFTEIDEAEAWLNRPIESMI